MANKMTAETRTLATLALLTALLTACAALSGFYYDNGVDQTVVHKQLSKREKREMQSEILHLLGLHHRPHPATPAASGLLRPRPSVPQDATASSAPRFLIDVYQSLMEEDSGDLKLKPDLIEREFNVTDGDVHSMDQADIIMSFVNRGRHLHSIRHHHGDGRFWFDLSEVPRPTTVLSAELRLFIDHSTAGGRDSVVSLYEIGAAGAGQDGGLVFVDRADVHRHQTGWIAFNVTLVLRNWLDNPEENLGLQLVCRDTATGHQISSRELGLVGSHGNQKLQPFMVAFLRAQTGHAAASAGASAASADADVEDDDADDAADAKDAGAEDEDEDEAPRHVGRFRRQAGNRKRGGKDPDEMTGSWNPYADFNAKLRKSCQKKNLYVSFKDLGWEDWIIAPDGYAAFYCYGECSFPLNAHMNASNHAIVQTLVHLMTPSMVPKPCCAPIKLSSISVLYFDDNSNVILKKYRNMVVKSCGCH